MPGIRTIDESHRPVEIDDVVVRRVTLGISLLDCASQLPATVSSRSYDKIRRAAGSLRRVVNDVTSFHGFECGQVDIAVTPMCVVADALERHDLIAIARSLDAAARDVGVDRLHGFSSIGPVDQRAGSKTLVSAVPSIIASTETLCASVDWGSDQYGIDLPTLIRLAEAIKEIEDLVASEAKLFLRVRGGASLPKSRLYHNIGEPDLTVSVDTLCDPFAGLPTASHLQSDGDIEEDAERVSFQATRIALFLRDRITDALSKSIGMDVAPGRAVTTANPTADTAGGWPMVGPSTTNLSLATAMISGIQKAQARRHSADTVLDFASASDTHYPTRDDVQIIRVEPNLKKEEIASVILERLTSPGFEWRTPFAVLPEQD